MERKGHLLRSNFPTAKLLSQLNEKENSKSKMQFNFILQVTHFMTQKSFLRDNCVSLINMKLSHYYKIISAISSN